MTLEKLAKEAGVRFVRCSKRQWGGHISYREVGHPNMTVCGFNSKKEACEHWLANTFNDRIGKLVLKVLKVKPTTPAATRGEI